MISPKLKTCIKNPESSTSQYQLYDIPAPSLSNVYILYNKLGTIHSRKTNRKLT